MATAHHCVGHRLSGQNRYTASTGSRHHDAGTSLHSTIHASKDAAGQLHGHDPDHRDSPVERREVGVQPGDEEVPGEQVTGVVVHQ